MAVTKHAQGFAGLGRCDETRQHHAVASGLARADGVEQAHDDHGQFAFLRVGECEEFIHQFRAGVAPARLMRRADEQIILLAERGFLALAVHFGRGGDEDRHAMWRGGFEQDFCLMQISFQNVDGRFDDKINAHCRCEMVNRFCVGHEFGQRGTGGNFPLDDLQSRIVFMRAQVLAIARGKIIQHHHALAVRQ